MNLVTLRRWMPLLAIRPLGLACLLAVFAAPLHGQLNYAEGGDPTDDPAVTDGVPISKRRYVDAVNGNDANDGQSPATAWKTVAKVNSSMSTFSAGTYILFKRGQTFEGDLKINCSGTSGSRIVFGAYGTGHSNGDGDPFNDTRPNLPGIHDLSEPNPTAWLMIRDLRAGKMGSGNVSDVVIFNNIVHGRVGQNQSNLIAFGDNATRCAIVQNLVYDNEINDLIVLHDSGAAGAAVGSSHWIIDNICIGNDHRSPTNQAWGTEGAIDLQMASVGAVTIPEDIKVIGNRIQMTAGTVPDLPTAQIYSGSGKMAIESNHLGRHIWILGNMISGARWRTVKHAGLKQYFHDRGNIVWRSSNSDRSVFDIVAPDVTFEHNTVIYSRSDPTYAVVQLLNDTAGGWSRAERTVMRYNLIIRATNGPWFGTWSASSSSISHMNWNWYGETISGTLNGMTFANWKSTTGFDANSGSGDVPLISEPPSNAWEMNPKNWYHPSFLAYFTPSSTWSGNSINNGAPAGALNASGTWFGGGPWGAGKWNPSQMLPFSTLSLNGGYGWAGPLIVQQRYPLPNAATPAAPSNLVATVDSANPSSQINLSWTDNSNNELAFEVDRATDSTFTSGLVTHTSPPSANATSFSSTGLSAGTVYYYRVRATNAAGDSANSNTASATTAGGGGGSTTIYEDTVLSIGAISTGDTHQTVSDANASGGSYHLFNANAAGDFITYTVNVATAGTYRVKIGGTKWTNRGIYQLKIGGVNQGAAQDYYFSSANAVMEERDLGNVTLSSGSHSFRLECTGKNASSGNYKHGLDYIKLVASEVHEGETLTVAASSGDSTQVVTDAAASGDQYHLFNANAATDYITYTVNVQTAGTYTVVIGGTKWTNRGIYQLKINNVNQGAAQDYYFSSTNAVMEERTLGSVTLSAGNHAFRFECTGKNASSGNYKHGLDHIKLLP